MNNCLKFETKTKIPSEILLPLKEDEEKKGVEIVEAGLSGRVPYKTFQKSCTFVDSFLNHNQV